MAPPLNTVILGIRGQHTALGGHKGLDCDVSDGESCFLSRGSSKQHGTADGTRPGTLGIVGT